MDELMSAFLNDPQVNDSAKSRLYGQYEADDVIAKAIVHFAFRNGPVEDMHADPNSQLSQDDMKVLNKHMHNRLTYVFSLVRQERWFELEYLCRSGRWYGSQWDKATPDDGGLREIMLSELEAAVTREEDE